MRRAGVFAEFKSRRCLVSGGLGFIGSNLVVALDRAGAEITVVDALIHRHGGDRRNVGDTGADVIVADIGDRASVDDAVARAEYIFDLAGQVSHVDSMQFPLVDLDLNTRSHLALLESMREMNPHVTSVFTSTRQVYGRPRYLPVDESHPVCPVDVNGVCKHAAEQFFLLYEQRYGFRTSVLRLSNVFGPRQRLRGDHQGFIASFLRRAVQNEVLTVFGDGQQKRDCVFVDDVVEAVALAALSDHAVGEVFNIGHNELLPLAEIAETIVEIAGSGEITYTPWPRERSAIDIGSFATDTSKAKRLLGWEPETAFADGVEQTVQFIRAHQDWYL